MRGADSPFVGVQEDGATMEDRTEVAGRVLIAGVPRSGTTFLARVLAATRGAGLVNEPDNPASISGCRIGRGLGTFPLLEPGEAADGLEVGFAAAFGPRSTVDAVRRRAAAVVGAMDVGRRNRLCANPRMPALPLHLRAALALSPPAVGVDATVRIVKTVHQVLSIDWLTARFPATLVLTRRHPLDILASWTSLGFDPAADDWSTFSSRPIESVAARFDAPSIPDRSCDSASMTVRAWIIGLLGTAVEQAVARHPDAIVVDHEAVCADPESMLRDVAGRAGLVWTDEASRVVRDANRPGSGYSTNRLASTVPGSWRRRLAPDDAQEAIGVLEQFEWARRYDGVGPGSVDDALRRVG